MGEREGERRRGRWEREASSRTWVEGYRSLGTSASRRVDGQTDRTVVYTERPTRGQLWYPRAKPATMTDISRRRTLRRLGGALLGLGGCLGGDSDGGDAGGDSSPDGGTVSEEETRATTGEGTAAGTDDTAGPASDATTGDSEATTGTASAAPSPRRVTFASSGGSEVVATRWGDGDCAAAFLHGVGYDRRSWDRQARAVADRGHVALSLSLDHDDRSSNVRAVAGAVEHLRGTVGVGRIVLVGASAGANAVVKADANAGVDVAGLVLLAPGRAADLGGRLHGEKLFLVGADDSERFVETTERLHGDASEPKRLVRLDSAEHAQGIFDTAAGDRLGSLLIGFVDDVCAGGDGGRDGGR